MKNTISGAFWFFSAATYKIQSSWNSNTKLSIQFRSAGIHWEFVLTFHELFQRQFWTEQGKTIANLQYRIHYCCFCVQFKFWKLTNFGLIWNFIEISLDIYIKYLVSSKRMEDGYCMKKFIKSKTNILKHYYVWHGVIFHIKGADTPPFSHCITLSLIRQFCSRRLWTYFIKT